MSVNSREQLLEALLFENGEGYSTSELSRFLNCDIDEVEEALADLSHALTSAQRGVRLMRSKDRAQLVTCEEASELLQSIRKEPLMGELSPATLETLTIVLYLGPVTKQRIDYIRGVNSQNMLRTLRARDLVSSSRHAGVVHYEVTLSTLRYLGVETVSELPDYIDVRAQFETTLAGDEATNDDTST